MRSRVVGLGGWWRRSVAELADELAAGNEVRLRRLQAPGVHASNDEVVAYERERSGLEQAVAREWQWFDVSMTTLAAGVTHVSVRRFIFGFLGWAFILGWATGGRLNLFAAATELVGKAAVWLWHL